MDPRLIERYLCCPRDGTWPLLLEDAQYDDGEIQTGRLRCPICASTYTITGGIPHMISVENMRGEGSLDRQREAAARDADAAVYDNSVPHYQTRIETAALLGALQPRPGDVIADVGAGTGRLTTALARSGALVLALDISPFSLELNRAKCALIPGARVHFIVCDACYLPLRPVVVDKVCSAMLLEHIASVADRARYAEELLRALKPDGALAVTVYNYGWSRRRRGERDGFHGKNLFYHRFEPRELRSLLRGFRVQRMTALLNLPGRVRIRALDNLIASLPLLAQHTGELLFVQACR